MTVASKPASAARRIPTLQSLSAAQIDAIRAIPPHEQANVVATVATRPTSIFLDDARFQSEKRYIFNRLPVPVVASAALPEPNMVQAHDGYGLPLLVTRDAKGVARVFMNVCRHKGSKIIEVCEPHKSGLLLCPYHAWSYALDGRLAAIPREETFPGIAKQNHGLVELPSREAGGLIWAQLDRNVQPDFANVNDELVTDLNALGIPNAFVYGHKRFELAANWKLVLEPFLEGYHVQRLHARSIGQLFADVPNVFHRLGPHIRQISGKANFEPEMLEHAGENIHKTVTHAYLVFPNTVVVTSPYYISLMVVMPQAVARSCVDYYMLTPGAPDDDTAADLYARSYELILKVFGTEDFRAAEISQVGLSTGVQEEMIYGGMETSIPAFYDTLERHLN